jgi:hypothetical protein
LKKKYEGRWEELVEREAVRLGVKYQIAGKWCSFVAVEGDVEHEPLVFRKMMPPMKQFMSHSSPGTILARSSMPCSPDLSFLAHSAQGQFDPQMLQDDEDELIPLSRRNIKCKSATSPQRPGACTMARRMAPSRAVASTTFSAPAQTGHPTPEDKMHAIIRLQKSNGSWDWTQQLQDTLGIIDTNHRHPRLQNAVVATALAVAFLSNRMANEAHTWELIVEKAKAWLVQQYGVDVKNEISEAEKLLA